MDVAAIVRDDEVMQGAATAAAGSLTAAQQFAEAEERRAVRAVSEVCSAATTRISDTTFVISTDFESELNRLKGEQLELRLSREVGWAILTEMGR